MPEVYDNWEKLVEAILDREELRQLALCPSFRSSSSADLSPRYSFDSTILDFSALALESIPFYSRLRQIPLKDIQKATRNFRQDLRLGGGPFGVIYKGRILRKSLSEAKGFMRAISVSRTTVAVKKVDPGITMDLKEWLLTEIKYLSQLDHPNVVKFNGYSNEGDNMVLVYELMPEGSLDYHLFREKHQPLSWNTRIKVAVDIARGLSFLHDREMQVIHGDLHIGHILLDGEFNAKLSGFGLAIDGPGNDQSLLFTKVRGTSGFCAPEYIERGNLSTKCDVFSFGVILLQILSGRRFQILEENDLEEMMKAYTSNKLWLSRIIDPRLEDQFPRDQAHVVATLAQDCLNSNPELRPQMCEVLVALESLLRFKKR